MSPATGLGSGADRDGGGFAPLGGYAVLGDGRGLALLAADGSVDWWAAPRLDSPPVVSSVLDPARGGRLRLAPRQTPTRCERAYLPGTAVLTTTWTTASGRARVTAALDVGSAGPLPWAELALRVEGLEGTVALDLELTPGDGLRAWQPWVEVSSRGPILHAGPHTLAVCCEEQVRLEVHGRSVTGRLEVAAGRRTTLGVVAAQDDPLLLADPANVEDRLARTVEHWQRWSDGVRWAGPRRDRVLRSAVSLRLLMMSGAGAMAAAGTTALPERVGGPKNWDYRYAWVRDAAFTIDALDRLGLEEEVHAATSWLLHSARDGSRDLPVMLGLDGTTPPSQRRVDVPGYRDSTPVLVGNRAGEQRQLGIYGDLFGTVERWVRTGHVLDVHSRRQLADLADRCADTWLQDDSGIWELPEQQPWTYSKMSCWRALTAAADLADSGDLPGPGERWRSEAGRVRAWVEQHCWSQAHGAWTAWAGSEDLDAAVLLGAQAGFDTGPRMSSTIDAVGRRLGAGPLVYRYSGAAQEEETFLACAFWRVHALVLVGRREEAASLLEQLEPVFGELGVLSEMAVAGTAEARGNLPQALSHLAHIGAVLALDGGGGPDRSEQDV